MIDWDSCVLWLDSKYFTESYWWDRSKYQNNGEVHGAKWKANSFHFDGESDYIGCGNNKSLVMEDAITIEAWVNSKYLGNTKRMQFISKTNSYIFETNTDGRLAFAWYKSGSGWKFYTKWGVTFNEGWNHLVSSFAITEGGGLYVNGNKVYTIGSDSGEWRSGESLYIGKYPPNFNYFEGNVALVRIFNIRFYDADIKILYDLTYKGV